MKVNKRREGDDMRYRLVFLKVQGIVVVDRMLKAMIKSLENKHLSPGPLVEDPVDFYGEPFI
jgi:hypothetical protein